MFETQTYERIPFPVQAVQVTEANFDELAQWTKGAIHIVPAPNKTERKYIKIDAVQNPQNDKQMKAYVGDVILYADKGGFKIYTKKAFDRSFRKVAGSPTTQVVLLPAVEEQKLQEAMKKLVNNHSHELSEPCEETCPVAIARGAVDNISAGNIMPAVISTDRIQANAISAEKIGGES